MKLEKTPLRETLVGNVENVGKKYLTWRGPLLKMLKTLKKSISGDVTLYFIFFLTFSLLEKIFPTFPTFSTGGSQGMLPYINFFSNLFNVGNFFPNFPNIFNRGVSRNDSLWSRIFQQAVAYTFH